MAAFMEEAKRGISDSVIDVRIRSLKDQYIWCRIRAATQYSAENTPLRAVGTISDIDEEKRMVEELRRRAELDALTGLYNHTETERRSELYLADKPDTICAMFIIDVDNFKLVNDGQGHLFGDAVLAELAAGMKKITRKSDVIGRIGGDEFAMFLKDLPSVSIAEDKARKLLQLFQDLFQGEKQSVEVTCSIGLAVYPWDGSSYQELYTAQIWRCIRPNAGGRTGMHGLMPKAWRRWSGLAIPLWERPSIRIRLLAERPVIWSIMYFKFYMIRMISMTPSKQFWKSWAGASM